MLLKIAMIATATGILAATLGAASKPVTVEMKNAKGESVGTAVLSDSGGGVKIKLNLKNLPRASMPSTSIRWRNANRLSLRPAVTLTPT